MRRGVGRYATVLRHGPAVRPFAASIVARLPISMAPLGMLLLVRQVQGSYGYAGVVAGAFAAGTALGGPWWGSRVDRLGQTRVMLATSLTSAATLAAVAVLAVGSGPPLLLLLVAAAAGLTFPPVGPGMRATWLTTLPDRPRRQVAFALDAAAVESLFVGGPLLLSLLLVVSPPVVPLLVTAGLLAGGGTAYSLCRAVRSQVPQGTARVAPRRRGWLPHVLRTPGVPAVLLVTTAFSLGFGHIDTSMAATSRQVLHHPDLIGLLFTAIAGGSASGGLVYGALAPSQSEHRRLPTTLGVLALGLTPLPFLLAFAQPRLWWLMSLLFLAGLAIAPSVIICQNLIENLTSRDQVSQVQAWLSTAGTAGQAAGTALAGVLVDRLGVSWSFAAAAAAVSLGSVISAAYRNRWALAR